MKLSELCSQGSESGFEWGVVRDCDSLSVPAGLKEISLVAEISNGELSAELMDVVIAYRLEGVQVVIEVPYASLTDVDPDYLVKMAQCLDASLSFLPPAENVRATEMGNYGEAMARYAKILLAQRNYVRHMIPVSSYIIYMMSESVEDMSDFVPSHPYLLSRFHHALTTQESDGYKQIVRGAVFEKFGGVEAFQQYSRSLMSGVLAVASAPAAATA